jgi:hypothetical protein
MRILKEKKEREVGNAYCNSILSRICLHNSVSQVYYRRDKTSNLILTLNLTAEKLSYLFQ